jgi:hypothetical protein
MKNKDKDIQIEENQRHSDRLKKYWNIHSQRENKSHESKRLISNQFTS